MHRTVFWYAGEAVDMPFIEGEQVSDRVLYIGGCLSIRVMG